MTLSEFIAQLAPAVEAKHAAGVDVVALGSSSLDALEALAPSAGTLAIARAQLTIAGGESARSQGEVGRTLVVRAVYVVGFSCADRQAAADLLAPLWL